MMQAVNPHHIRIYVRELYTLRTSGQERPLGRPWLRTGLQSVEVPVAQRHYGCRAAARMRVKMMLHDDDDDHNVSVPMMYICR